MCSADCSCTRPHALQVHEQVRRWHSTPGGVLLMSSATFKSNALAPKAAGKVRVAGGDEGVKWAASGATAVQCSAAPVRLGQCAAPQACWQEDGFFQSGKCMHIQQTPEHSQGWIDRLLAPPPLLPVLCRNQNSAPPFHRHVAAGSQGWCAPPHPHPHPRTPRRATAATSRWWRWQGATTAELATAASAARSRRLPQTQGVRR